MYNYYQPYSITTCDAKRVIWSCKATSWADAIAQATASGTSLTLADFRNTNLTNAVFYKADLRYADFTGACLDNARFIESDTTGAFGLEGVVVGIETGSVQDLPEWWHERLLVDLKDAGFDIPTVIGKSESDKLYQLVHGLVFGGGNNNAS